MIGAVRPGGPARPRRSGRSRRRGHQRGVGLIEILISVVLLSIGFLAAARMQVEGMRFSQSAYHQSQAYLLASDMIDRMRSNVEGVSEGHYAAMSTADELTDPGCDAAVACSAAQRALQDLFDWRGKLQPRADDAAFVPALPASAVTPAVGTIARIGGTRYRIQLTWSEQIGDAEVPQTLFVNFAAEQ